MAQQKTIKMDQTLLSADQPERHALEVDAGSASYLGETASWAKFLAIVGFIMCGLFVVFGLFMGSLLSFISSSTQAPIPLGFGGAMTVIYIGLAALYFFPCYYMYVFATKTKYAIATNNQAELTVAFRNLKSSFKFAGIMMLIIIGIWVLALLAGLAGAALS